jgi:hypothetical protein
MLQGPSTTDVIRKGKDNDNRYTTWMNQSETVMNNNNDLSALQFVTSHESFHHRDPPILSHDAPFVAYMDPQTVSDGFPSKLHIMLSEIEEQGLGHVVSWQPHGRWYV